jgi:hypothetical protein
VFRRLWSSVSVAVQGEGDRDAFERAVADSN